MSAVWEVVGGAGNGGIIVRDGWATTSAQAELRLATGSRVRALQHDAAAGRLQFELLEGAGPSSGWVSTKYQGKALLATMISQEASMVDKQSQDGSQDDQAGVAQQVSPASQEALRKYAHNLRQACCDTPGAVQKLAEDNEQVSARMPKTLIQMELDRDIDLIQMPEKTPAHPRPQPECTASAEQLGGPYKVVKDSDGEELHLCCHCRLPLGEFAYVRDGKYMHGECISHTMEKDLKAEDELRHRGEMLAKEKQRAIYDIGWTKAQIPSNSAPAKRLVGHDVCDGMVCVVLDKGTNTVKIAATTEPAASVNLEYLSIALQVRRREGHEPVFSLNPVNPNGKNTMQEKVFVPQWLAGTSVGEVLFQADYILKELSMGEQQQPVLGMQSCFDFTETEGFGEKWDAREWFMVRKAEVQMSESNVLIPCVKLGVEARELVMGGKGLEDAPITRADHPMVRYAESFTHNFDLIAERRSAIFHLRELAKAVVLAKFLLDTEVPLPEDWFQLAQDSSVQCSFGWEVPQLWHERMHSCISVEGGVITNRGRKAGASLHGIYGGVNLSVENFDLAASIAGRVGRAARAGRAIVPPPSGMMPSDSIHPQGVDLRLKNFDFSNIKRVPLETSVAPLDACSQFGQEFWCALDSGSEVLHKSEKEFLSRLFNSNFSDRRMEGDLFVPPHTKRAYVDKLQLLLDEEEHTSQNRKECFCSKLFDERNPGPLFPSSWASSKDFVRPRTSDLIWRPLYAVEQLLVDSLRSVRPEFDKTTEDGVKFRIYNIGSLEVRCIQEAGCPEDIVAVFAMSSLPRTLSRGPARINQRAKVVKVTEFVERTAARDSPCSDYSYYMALETELGHTVVTEQTCGGNPMWQEHPEHLDERNSVAKATRSATCATGITLEQLKNAATTFCQSRKNATSSTGCASKDYCRTLYSMLCGTEKDLMLFKSPADSTWCEVKEVKKAGTGCPFPLMARKPSEYKLMANRFNSS